MSFNLFSVHEIYKRFHVRTYFYFISLNSNGFHTSRGENEQKSLVWGELYIQV